jgi:hypothetical protein
VDNPAPTVTTLASSITYVGETSPVITLSGTGFVPNTVVNVNGSARPTTFTSPTQINVALSAADILNGGSLSLTAASPAPGGGTSSALNLTVNNPYPQPSSLTPTSVLTNATTPPTITVTGSYFVPSSTVQVNSTARTTTYVSSTQLTFQLAASDLAEAQQLSVSVVNPTPGGGTGNAGALNVLQTTPAPVLSQASPNTFVAGSDNQSIQVYGTNLVQQIAPYNSVSTATIQWNGSPLTTYGFGTSGLQQYISAQVPASLLTTTGTASITVVSQTSTPATSNALSVSITNPPAPTLTAIYPNSGPLNTATAITLNGTGFTSNSIVALNGTTISSTYISSTELTAIIPAASAALPGNLAITVTTPAPGGGTASPLAFTVFLSIPNNDIVFNPTDGLLYASVPNSAPNGITGNSIAGIDPLTGTVVREIWVGSNPNKLALSTDGSQMFVGLDGAGAVAQVDLTKGAIVNQFSLGSAGGSSAPSTAAYLAAVPGLPNSVAVATNGNYGSGSSIAIYDSGVARAKNSSSFFSGVEPLSFGSSASTLYVWNSNVMALTVDSTGISASNKLYVPATYSNPAIIQYDNGRIYLSNGEVVDATSGLLIGTFYTSPNSPASGPIASDATIGRAFVASTSFAGNPGILAFSESTFNPTGTIAVNGIVNTVYPYSFEKIARWGQDGIAVNTQTQIFLFQSPVVKDLSASPADMSVDLAAPSTATTGTAISYVATVSNGGPNQANGITLALTLDSSLIINSVTASQGACNSGATFTCDLGNLASGATATVTISATPSTSGTIAGSAVVDSTSYDPAMTNNQATSSTTVTGSLYSMPPAISAVSPALVQADGDAFTLTVTGSGFDANSTVNLGGTALTSALVSATELTANVTASEIADYGWAPVTVTNTSPGGGISQELPLTIYALLNVPASGMLFDPFSQQLYATVPSTSTTVAGNSVVSIDPITAKASTPVLVGSEPDVMTETTDGNYLWIGLSGAQSITQFDLLHQKVTAIVPLAVAQSGSVNSVTANWLVAMPGADNTLAVSLAGSPANFGIFDVSGNTGTFRTNFSAYYSGGSDPVFADATHVYADNQNSGSPFYRYAVDANGLTLLDATTLNGMSGPIQLANGVVFGGSGGIANPQTTPPSQIAVLSPVDFYQSGNNSYEVGVVPDASTNKEFVMLENVAGTWGYALARYDTVHYVPETWVPMPASTNNSSTIWTMLRWGQDGLALLASVNGQSYPQGASAILLLRGPFVTPQLLDTGTAATLSSSSASSLTHGAGNTILALTGSNFAPGVAVTWNGSYRTTTLLDATHVTVAIPASDLASIGSATLIATNPGGPTSNALSITIQ